MVNCIAHEVVQMGTLWHKTEGDPILEIALQMFSWMKWYVQKPVYYYSRNSKHIKIPTKSSKFVTNLSRNTSLSSPRISSSAAMVYCTNDYYELTENKIRSTTFRIPPTPK